MKKKLVRGKDWHGYAWKHLGDGSSVIPHGCLMRWAEPTRPPEKHPTEKGKWVRVKFVEVKR